MIGTIHVPESNSLNQDSRPEQLEVCTELASMSLFAAKNRNHDVELIKNATWKFSASSISVVGSDLQCHSQLTWLDDSPVSLLPGDNYRIDLIAERNISTTGSTNKFSKLFANRKEPGALFEG